MTAPVAAAVQVLRRVEDAVALVPEWDGLADRCALGFAARPSYSLTWFKALGRGELAVVTARRDGRLVAVAPLHLRRLLGQPVLRWLGHGLGTVGEVLAEDQAAASSVWEHLAAQGVPLQLTHVRLDDAGTLALRRSPSWSVRLEVDDRCPVLSLPPGIDAAALRSKRSTKRLRQYREALEREQGPFLLEVVQDAEALRRRWPDVVRVAAAADAGRDRIDLCAPPYDAFTLSFLEEEARAGRLLLVGATAGGRWVAQEVGVRTGDRFAMWLSRFDPLLSGYAPGHLVLSDLLPRAGELGLTCLDFGPGENAYKLAWAGTAYDIATLTAVPGGQRRVRARLQVAGSLGAAARRVRR